MGRITYISLSVLICFVISCSENEPARIKPENVNSKDNMGIISNERRLDNQTKFDEPDILSDPSLTLQRRFINHISMMELGCGYYHDAYGRMPVTLDDLKNGFMLIWPGDVYSGEPLKEIKDKPNPTTVR
jgi:hypothetical protein